ncbi:MAG: sigma-70 family RNA polymerase sigma factor [Candidatus Omnitrophica bacterium]|nr:sigma-70 family RNA polymerase sigma factor [Candidatus Omnitrophota bacterium]
MSINKNYKKLDIKALIHKCTEKNPLAWAEFISRYSPLAYRAIRKRLENHNFRFNKEDIEDLRQGLFIKIWQGKSLETVRNAPDIKYWIVMIAANFASDFYRRSQKDVLNKAASIFEEVVINNRNIALGSFIKSDIPSPRKKIEKNNLKKIIENTFSELSSKQRIAVKLNIFHNKKYREISKILKVSLGNVSSLIRRAKLKIKKNLQQNG